MEATGQNTVRVRKHPFGFRKFWGFPPKWPFAGETFELKISFGATLQVNRGVCSPPCHWERGGVSRLSRTVHFASCRGHVVVFLASQTQALFANCEWECWVWETPQSVGHGSHRGKQQPHGQLATGRKPSGILFRYSSVFTNCLPRMSFARLTLTSGHDLVRCKGPGITQPSIPNLTGSIFPH